MQKCTLEAGDQVNVYITGYFGGNHKFKSSYKVYEKGGKLGIDYGDPYKNNGDMFVPFQDFSGSTVGFEDVKTGVMFHMDNIKKCLVPGTPTRWNVNAST